MSTDTGKTPVVDTFRRDKMGGGSILCENGTYGD